MSCLKDTIVFKRMLKLHPSQGVHVSGAITPLSVEEAASDMPAQHRWHNQSVVGSGNRSASGNRNRPVTTDVMTRRGLGTTLDSHRTLELGSHFSHSKSAITGHCHRMNAAERAERRRRLSNRASRSVLLSNVCHTCTCTLVSVFLSANERRVSKRTCILVPLILGGDYTNTLDTI